MPNSTTADAQALPPSAWLAIGAAALGGMLYGYDIGIIAGAAVFMDIVAATGYAGAFSLLAISVFAYMLVAIFPLPETRGRPLEAIESHFLGGPHDG